LVLYLRGRISSTSNIQYYRIWHHLALYPLLSLEKGYTVLYWFLFSMEMVHMFKKKEKRNINKFDQSINYPHKKIKKIKHMIHPPTPRTKTPKI